MRGNKHHMGHDDRATGYKEGSTSLGDDVVLGTGIVIGVGIFASTGQIAPMAVPCFPMHLLSARL